ncbi:MAG: Amidohydrolase family, partial [Pseudonocardiales bacterium]|nr:Amidohydrolase family [Pseudonocardiales bacterium]
SITPGKYADLVILNRDPRVGDPATIADIAVAATIRGGEFVYEAAM